MPCLSYVGKVARVKLSIKGVILGTAQHATRQAPFFLALHLWIRADILSIVCSFINLKDTFSLCGASGIALVAAVLDFISFQRAS